MPALTTMPSSPRISKEGFYGGPDMLHSLHCLNALRKHLDIEYYAESMTLPPEYRRMHVDHCVDHLRQALLCHGVLTPVTMTPVTSITSLPYAATSFLGQTERLHTCHNPERIPRRVTERRRQTGRIKPIHPRHMTKSLMNRRSCVTLNMIVRLSLMYWLTMVSLVGLTLSI